MKKILFASLLALFLMGGISFATVDVATTTAGSFQGSNCTAEHLVVPTGNVTCNGNYATLLNTVNTATSSTPALQGVAPNQYVNIDGSLGSIFNFTVTTNISLRPANLVPGWYGVTFYSQGTSSLNVYTTYTNIKTSGTSIIATGATSGKTFAISYFSDGNYLFEVQRSIGTAGAGM